MKVFAGIEQRAVVSGAGRRVVFVHGVGSHLESWDGVIAELANGYESLRYDLRGHGDSEKVAGPYSLDSFVGDLVALVDALQWTRFDLVGFSLGGLIAQAFALRYGTRIRTLSIISSVSGRTPDEQARAVARARILATDGARAHVDSSAARWFTDEFRAAHPEVVAQRLRRSLENDPHCYAAAYRVLAESDLLGDLHRVAAPTLVMTGEDDQGSTPRMARAMAAAIPGAQAVIFPRLRHSILLEAPDLVGRTLKNFLELHKDPLMDQELFEQGMAMRRAVLGDAYVDKALAQAGPFARDFQRFVTEYCWGECWTDTTLSRRDRSLLNLGMIAALGKMHEFELHVAGALRNGLTEPELFAALKQVAVYCGVPVGVDCFRVAREAVSAAKLK